jgi:hypothetical protein
MEKIGALIVALLGYYATLGIMGIGFATMVRGPLGAMLAWRFFFLRPARWAGREVLRLVSALLRLGIRFIVSSWRFVLHHVIDPLILGIERVVIWLLTFQSGWLRR